MEVKEEIKVNLSWKIAFLVRCHMFIGGLVGVAVSLYFILIVKDDFLFHYIWIPSLFLSLLEVAFSIYHMYSLTKATTTHLIISVFPVQMLSFFLRVIWSIYIICLVLYKVSSLGPDLIFVCFILGCLGVDSLSVILVLSAILANAETLTRFLSKY